MGLGKFWVDALKWLVFKKCSFEIAVARIHGPNNKSIYTAAIWSAGYAVSHLHIILFIPLRAFTE